METRWMKRKNENGEEEKFYPITHAKAIVYGDDGSEAIHNGYVVRSELVKKSVEVSKSDNDNDAVYENRVFSCICFYVSENICRVSNG